MLNFTEYWYIIKYSVVRAKNMNEGLNLNVVGVEKVNEESYFDGGLLQLIGWRLLGFIVTAITFGICFPAAFCMIYKKK